MTAAKKTETPLTVEERLTKLEETTAQLKRRGSETNRRIGALEKLVDAMPGKVAKTITDATEGQTAEFKVLLAQSETRTADRVTAVARQTPTWAVIAITILAGLLANIFCAAMHWPHIG